MKLVKRIFPNSDFTEAELFLVGLNVLWLVLFFSQLCLTV